MNFQARVFPALMAGFDVGLSDVYDGRLYASVPPTQPEYPLAVYQSQDGGGVRLDTLGKNGWEGLITFRSIDTTMSGAWNKLYQLVQAIPQVVASGYLIEYRPEHPMWMPVEKVSAGNIYTAAIIVTFNVYNDN